MRLDRALAQDLRRAWCSWPIRLYLLLQLSAGAVFVLRRGGDTTTSVLLIWSGMGLLAFVAWWSGRHRLAHPQPDAVPAAGPKVTFASLGIAGMTMWGFGLNADFGFVLVASAIGAWLWSALRGGGHLGLSQQLLRDPRPFVPLLVLIGLPRLLAVGSTYVLGATLALPSGIGQEVLYLIGLFAPLEAFSGRAAMAAVVSALLFALMHVPHLLDANGADLAAAVANAVLFQASVGLIACLAYRRHRAPVPIGIAHALAIG
jgi:hypothetical protein